MDIKVIIDDMVQKMGYRTYPGFPQDYIWVDHGDGSGEVILLLEHNDIEKVREFQSSTSSFSGERFVFILVKDVNQEIISYCKYHKITAVKDDEVAKILGRAVIEMYLESRKEETTANDREQQEGGKGYILVYLEEGQNPRYIKPTIDANDVVKTVGLKPELIFVPYHFFSYSLKVMEGEIVGTREGTLMVNAVNGKVYRSINGFELLDVWPTDHREMEIKWEPLPSLERAKKWLEDTTETEIVEKKETQSFIIYTRKSVKPIADTIKVTFLNTCFYPIYSSSAIAMDGFTSEIISISDVF
ncbi:MAG: hypothetical protein QXO03_00150 [Thermoplasmatales archaeon]